MFEIEGNSFFEFDSFDENGDKDIFANIEEFDEDLFIDDEKSESQAELNDCM